MINARSALVLAHLYVLVSLSCCLGGCAAGAVASPSEAVDGRGDALDGARSTLWIHGRSTSGATREGDYDDFSYWGDGARDAGVQKRAVNWDGRSRIAASNGVIRRALDCFCTGARSCYVAAHSAGDAQIGYALDLYGASERDVTDGVPDASGACAPTGEKQNGWNVLWVEVAGGAGGGTELADLGSWAVSDPLTGDLKTSTARALYDHNETRGAAFYMVAGAKGTLYSGLLPGQDDEVIAYHSAGALSDTGSFCNPGDHFCDDALQMGSGSSFRGGREVPKWANHSVSFRDDSEAFDHYTRNAWSGVVAVAANDVADYAQ